MALLTALFLGSPMFILSALPTEPLRNCVFWGVLALAERPSLRACRECYLYPRTPLSTRCCRRALLIAWRAYKNRWLGPIHRVPGFIRSGVSQGSSILTSSQVMPWPLVGGPPFKNHFFKGNFLCHVIFLAMIIEMLKKQARSFLGGNVRTGSLWPSFLPKFFYSGCFDGTWFFHSWTW